MLKSFTKNTSQMRLVDNFEGFERDLFLKTGEVCLN